MFFVVKIFSYLPGPSWLRRDGRFCSLPAIPSISAARLKFVNYEVIERTTLHSTKFFNSYAEIQWMSGERIPSMNLEIPSTQDVL
ncbi:hypothetical protein [Sphingobium sp. CFD-1]|uniref:hypothetical protein n=1 Tax=Sphingobium sp. CFD-1 TaxID=2878545 RepID=UPI00214C0A48|nr:hypothetical protein [Sphingobium sp. CFD-1]